MARLNADELPIAWAVPPSVVISNTFLIGHYAVISVAHEGMLNKPQDSAKC